MPTQSSEEARALFGQLQSLAHSSGSYKEAKKLLKRIERIRLGLSTESRAEYAEVTETYGFALLNIAPMPRGKKLQDEYQEHGYRELATSVDLFLKEKHDVGTAFRASNLGADLLHKLNEPERALPYLLMARQIYSHIPRSHRPRFDDYGLRLATSIAACHLRLGDSAKAARILRVSIGKTKIRLHSWSALRTFSRAYELLSDILLDAKRA